MTMFRRPAVPFKGGFSLHVLVPVLSLLLAACAPGAVSPAVPTSPAAPTLEAAQTEPAGTAVPATAAPTASFSPPALATAIPAHTEPVATAAELASTAGAASTPAATDGPVAGSPADVKIVEPAFKPPQSWTYDPVTVTVKVGTMITWVNTGAVLHTVTSDDGKTFDSKDIAPKATWSFTPTAVGAYTYHCTYHPWMKGTIIVQP